MIDAWPDTVRPDATSGEPSLSGDEARGVALLVAGATPDEAAVALDCHRSTIYRWLQAPAFAGALRQARTDRWRALGDRAAAGAGRVLRRLRRLALSPGTPAAVQVRACDAYLGRVLTLAEAGDFAERLAAIEARLPAPADPAQRWGFIYMTPLTW